MTEWTVVTVIVAIVGLIATVAAPIVKLTGTINALSGKVELLLNNLEDFKQRYKETLEDLKETDQRQYNQLFLSTLPARGATRPLPPPRAWRRISIHAPREGSDLCPVG